MKKILLLLSLFICLSSLAQNAPVNITPPTTATSFPSFGKTASVAIGYLQTEAEQQGIRFAMKYINDINAIDVFKAYENASLSFAPNIEMKLGSNDAFNGIVGKFSGLLSVAKPTNITLGTGTVVPVIDIYSFHSVFPFSGGFETDRTFNNVNVLLEAGYIPWYQNIPQKATYNGGKFITSILRSTKIGAFLQAGYKLNIAPTTVNPTKNPVAANSLRGDTNNSAEVPNDAITRIKTSLRYSPRFYFNKNKSQSGIGISGEGNVWFDLLHSKIYHNLEGKFTFYAGGSVSFDFMYEKGSGAPLFNPGEQFSGNLNIAF